MKLWHVAGCSMCLYSLACLYTVPHALCRRQCRTRISEKGVAVGGTAPPIANLSKKTALRWQDPRSSVARPALRWRERAFFFKRREREPVRGHRVREGKRGRHTMTQSAEWPCTSGGTLRRHGSVPAPPLGSSPSAHHPEDAIYSEPSILDTHESFLCSICARLGRERRQIAG